MTVMIIVDALLLLILLYLLVAKTLHFFRKIRHRRFIDWFYFNKYNITLSSSPESADAKKQQNNYTIKIGITILVIIFTVYLEVLMLM